MAAEENTPERWLPVVGYEGFYEVSDRGRVRSLSRMKRNGRRLNGRVLSTPLSEGYPCCNLVRDSVQILNRVHRLVADAFIGNPEGCATVNHKDFDRTNNMLSNLEWLSPADNCRHAHAANRCAGNRVYKSGFKRMGSDVVRAIRRDHANGLSNRQIAEAHGVSRPHVSRIVVRKVWENVY